MARRTALPALDQSARPAENPSTLTASTSRPPDLRTSGAPTPISRRLTRSAARLAAESSSTNPPSTSEAPLTPSESRKRRAPSRREKVSNEADHISPPQRAKRARVAAPNSRSSQRTQGTCQTAAMSQSGSSRLPGDASKTRASSSTSRQRASRGKKSQQQDPAPSDQPAPRHQRRHGKRGSDVTMKEPDDDNEIDTTQEEEEEEEEEEEQGTDSSSGNNNNNNGPSGFSEEDDTDPFRSGLFGSRSPLGLHGTLRALSGMMSGISSKLRDILQSLRMKDDPSIQLIALQELSDLLLVSNEDTFAGHFAADAFVKELVALMQPGETGDENPEIMLLACRCLANMMEAIRGSVGNVVYGGAVPVLCQKLLDIQFIDLAEQALSTLAKISVEYPASIVRAGGLTACLMYLDFFPTSTQRTAVTTAANCCRNLPLDTFPVVREVMPTLLNVLSSNDQKVVEQGCICVSRVVESFKYRPEKLEELIEPDMLRAVLRLLLPGTTNLIGPHIHTQFLRVLSITCRSSPRLSVELLKMNVVDTLYQILTDVSPPSDVESNPVKVDNVHIMQALIHRPREQVYETLNVICEILPGVKQSDLIFADDDLYTALDSDVFAASRSSKAKELAQKRLELLKDCQLEMKRFAAILLPTLTEAYSSTVNLGVRQKVLIAQMKMLQDLDATIIEDALRPVPYASFLASILSQQDNLSLVALALQCARLLFDRLENIYQYQFHREGVIAEISRLAQTPLSTTAKAKEDNKMDIDQPETNSDNERKEIPSHDEIRDDMDDDEGSQDDEDNYNDEFNGDERDDLSESESSSSSVGDMPLRSVETVVQDLVTKSAIAFMRAYEESKGSAMRDKAMEILENLRNLVREISSSYKSRQSSRGLALFKYLATYFDGDAVDSITSAELLNSGLIDALLDVVGHSQDAKRDFLEAFICTGSASVGTVDTTSPTPFGTLIRKLHDLLSRTEHFEVITVNHAPFENRSAASMLSKQLRLRLVADEKSDIPQPYRNMMVSIHAIANFKTLDDYLRPRISLSERARSSRTRDSDVPSGAGESASGGSQESSSGRARAQPTASGANRGTTLPERTRRRATPGDSQEATPRTSRSRRHQPPPPHEESEESDAPLECADERHLSDDDEQEEEEDEDALDAIVDDLEDDLSDDGVHEDPSAVNMEVGSGGKVTARKEDGTRVATPSQSIPSRQASSSAAGDSSARTLGQALALAGRSFSSYAAAMAAIPQDWHLEFEINGKPISNDTTVYRAIHQSRASLGGSPTRNVWATTHTVKFRRVEGPPPPEPSTLASSAPDDDESGETMPESLQKSPITSSILQLLRVLHRLNSQTDYILDASKDVHVTPEALTQFINTKLTAKLNRQLEEPLIVASSCLPSWSEDLAKHFPFLFPFETRHLFLQSTCFGYARAMMRWQGNQNSDDSRRDQRRDDRPVARLQRQKVRISRNRILDSAMKVLELYGASPSVLEVEYFEEVGTGLGPTLEFYSTVSKEFSKKKLKLWRDYDPHSGGEYVVSKLGLFPAPMTEAQANQESGKKQLQYFKYLGKFVARSMLDSRIIDIHFNPAFFRVRDSSSGITPSIGTVKQVDPDLAKSLMSLKRFANEWGALKSNTFLSDAEKEEALKRINSQVEDLALDFTLPGYPHIDLIPNGSNTPVTADKIDLYIHRVIDMTLVSGVKPQLEAFRAGFSQVFPYSALKAFTADELVMLFGQMEEDWSIETLMDSIKADHGFNMDSRTVRNLLETMSQFTLQERRDFLQFVTGSPKLPIGGFKSLTPMFTVVCRPSEPPYTSDDYLPSVMTCVNYLKLPDYSSAEILRERLGVAMREGQGAFHLS
ncbi:hypothetical protein VTO42DRAFT_8133 [Malbranchea cinnamomea]